MDGVWKEKAKRNTAPTKEKSAPKFRMSSKGISKPTNQKWLTDVTEFSIPVGKVYLSPMIDCYDGMPVAWSISCRPDAQPVNTMLDCAIRILPRNVNPVVHSDRGCYYRWPGWIEWMRKAGLVRSMSKRDVLQTIQLVKDFWKNEKRDVLWPFLTRCNIGGVHPTGQWIHDMVSGCANQSIAWWYVSSGISNQYGVRHLVQ